jgi:hypothetical protein
VAAAEALRVCRALFPILLLSIRFKVNRVEGMSKALPLLLLWVAGVASSSSRPLAWFRVADKTVASKSGFEFAIEGEDDSQKYGGKSSTYSRLARNTGGPHELRMEEWVVVMTRRRLPCWWRANKKVQRFAFLPSGVVLRLQNPSLLDSSSSRNSSREEIERIGDSFNGFKTDRRKKTLTRRRRRRSGVEVGEWWFDKAGLRWDVAIGAPTK